MCLFDAEGLSFSGFLDGEALRLQTILQWEWIYIYIIGYNIGIYLKTSEVSQKRVYLQQPFGKLTSYAAVLFAVPTSCSGRCGLRGRPN